MLLFSADGGIGNRRVVGILCAEVGGMNSLEPLQVSATLGLPALDADGMGRAFPMLQVRTFGPPVQCLSVSQPAFLLICLIVCPSVCLLISYHQPFFHPADVPALY